MDLPSKIIKREASASLSFFISFNFLGKMIQ